MVGDAPTGEDTGLACGDGDDDDDGAGDEAGAAGADEETGADGADGVTGVDMVDPYCGVAKFEGAFAGISGILGMFAAMACDECPLSA